MQYEMGGRWREPSHQRDESGARSLGMTVCKFKQTSLVDLDVESGRLC